MKRRIRSKGGFSLLEVLVATGILAIFVAIAAVGTSAFFGTGEQMMSVSKAAVLGSDVMKSITNEIRFGNNFAVDADGALTYNSTAYGDNCRLTVAKEDGRLCVIETSTGKEVTKGAGAAAKETTFYPLGTAAYGRAYVKSLVFTVEENSSHQQIVTCTVTITSDGTDTLWEQTASLVPLAQKAG